MPTKRTRTPRFTRDFMTPTHWAWLHDDEKVEGLDWMIWHHLNMDHPNHPEPDPPRRVPFLESSVMGRTLWRMYEAEITAEHIAEYPGTRPLRWWQFDAAEPRRRLGGIGTPCHERLAHKLRLYLGVPLDWIMEDDVAIYRKINLPLDMPALDLKDPPTYESEATYLQRLKLLAAGERKRLKPADFEPEPITDYIDFSEDDPG